MTERDKEAEKRERKTEREKTKITSATRYDHAPTPHAPGQGEAGLYPVLGFQEYVMPLQSGSAAHTPCACARVLKPPYWPT
jgi:hypothetical protein